MFYLRHRSAEKRPQTLLAVNHKSLRLSVLEIIMGYDGLADIIVMRAYNVIIYCKQALRASDIDTKISQEPVDYTHYKRLGYILQ